MAGALVDAASLPYLARGVNGLASNPPPAPRPVQPTKRPEVQLEAEVQQEPVIEPMTPKTPRMSRKSRQNRPTHIEVPSPRGGFGSSPSTPIRESPSTPTRPTPWKASAARPEQQPKKNQGEGQRAAAAARAMAGTTRGRQLSAGSVANSLHLSTLNFPVPGQTMPSPRRSPSVKSDTSSDHNLSVAGSHAGNRSLAQYQCFAATHSRTGSTHSLRSGTSSKNAIGSLGEAVGFTFKNTTDFVHPNKQVPRSFRGRSSMGYQDEPEDLVVERMNSVTSDGGWASGWSVSGSQNAFASAPSALQDPFDLAPEESVAPITEEEDEPPIPLRRKASRIFGEQSSRTTSAMMDDGDQSPGRSASPTKSSEPTTKTGKSLRARASSLSIKRRAKEDAEESYIDASNTTSPVRASFDKAFGGILSREAEPEDPISRAANIAAARRAFEEKEAAKDKRAAEQEAKKEIRRRRSDARDRPHWMRRPSEAVDSGVEVIEEETDGDVPFGIGANKQRTGRSVSPGCDDSCDPLSRVPEQSSVHEQADFPVYNESQPDHSMFSAAYLDKPQDSAMFPPPQSSLFPPHREEGPPGGGMFQQVSSAQVYEIDGVLYDEYGEPIGGDETQRALSLYDDDDRGRRLSKTKVAKGALRKFSAWGKTRMLRV